MFNFGVQVGWGREVPDFFEVMDVVIGADVINEGVAGNGVDPRREITFSGVVVSDFFEGFDEGLTGEVFGNVTIV